MSPTRPKRRCRRQPHWRQFYRTRTQDQRETERRLAEETARAEGKPEASLSKIIEGRVTGFVKEVSLIEQAFAKDAKKTVKQILDEAGTAVHKFHRFRVGQ